MQLVKIVPGSGLMKTCDECMSKRECKVTKRELYAQSMNCISNALKRDITCNNMYTVVMRTLLLIHLPLGMFWILRDSLRCMCSNYLLQSSTSMPFPRVCKYNYLLNLSNSSDLYHIDKQYALQQVPRSSFVGYLHMVHGIALAR